MKIELEIEKADIKIVLQTLQSAMLQVQDAASKASLQNIVTKLQGAYWLDDMIFGAVYKLLDPYTNSTITLKSELIHQLSLDQQWINNFLHIGCNNIVSKLILADGSSKTPAAITASEATKCITVKDIVDLIKKTYESAA